MAKHKKNRTSLFTLLSINQNTSRDENSIRGKRNIQKSPNSEISEDRRNVTDTRFIEFLISKLEKEEAKREKRMYEFMALVETNNNLKEKLRINQMKLDEYKRKEERAERKKAEIRKANEEEIRDREG